jgi:HPt (histidine-containing phosphotransfer) domain-containing protein
MNDHIGKPIERAKLYETVWRWVGVSTKAAEHGSDSRDPSRFDRTRFDELVQVLGAAKAETMAHRFVDQFSSSFKSTPDISRREAHALINGAGVLGFGGLVDLCREIELAPKSAERELGARLTEMRLARKSVLTMLEKELLPDLRGAMLRRAG